jgi:nucleotide-binding universal stress UspA family protein
MRILVAVDHDSVSSIVSFIKKRNWDFSDRFRIITVIDRVSEDFSAAERSPSPGTAERALGQGYQNLIELVAHALQEAFPECLTTTCVLEGEVAEATIAEAEAWHADLITIGHHHKSALQKLLTGSVSTNVLNRAECSVLLIPVVSVDGARQFQIDESASKTILASDAFRKH